MGLLSKLKGRAREFIMKIALKKGLKSGIQALVSLLIGLKLQEYGFEVSIDPEALLLASTAGVHAALEFLRNLLKRKAPKLFGGL